MLCQLPAAEQTLFCVKSGVWWLADAFQQSRQASPPCTRALTLSGKTLSVHITLPRDMNVAGPLCLQRTDATQTCDGLLVACPCHKLFT